MGYTGCILSAAPLSQTDIDDGFSGGVIWLI